MSADVISHQEPRGKRDGAGSWTVQRVAVLLVAVAGVIAASWLALSLEQSATAPEQVTVQAPRDEQPAPLAVETTQLDVASDLVGAPLARTPARAAPRRRTGVPLDAGAAVEPAGYEILSAAELDGISQARE